MSAQQQPQLKHGLSNRHIQLIALGGSICTGLFLGISQTIKLAGPSVILGYALAGLIAFFMMRQLGEMVVEEPVSGSFSYFAYKFWSPFAGLSRAGTIGYSMSWSVWRNSVPSVSMSNIGGLKFPHGFQRLVSLY